MKLHTITSSLAILLFFCSLFLICSCQKTEVKKETKPVVTIANLQTAYAKAVKYSNMYNLFVKQAEKERNKNVANLYRAVAHSEEIRATNHANLLRSYGVEPVLPPEEIITVGTTMQTLKMALSSEDIQFNDIYPNMIRTAELEKDTAAVEQFTKARDADARHRELFFQALNTTVKAAKVEYICCSRCGYIFTSDKTDECPICNKKNETLGTS